MRTSASWPSASEARPPRPAAATAVAGFVILGNPDGRRVAMFQEALSRLGRAPARVVAWADLLAGRADLAGAVRPGDVVRLESPGKDFGVERALLAAGADEADEEDPGGRYDRIGRRAAESLPFDKGRVLCPRQWFLGFRSALRRVARELGELGATLPHRAMNDAGEVEVMFDKCRCHALLSAAGVAVPPAPGPAGAIDPIRGFDDLTARLRAAPWRRAFVKLAHGSSASGVAAFEQDGAGRCQATTTVEIVREGGEARLYNSRRARTYREPREVAGLIDALARHRVHVERWLPKAGIGGRVFDLRVVVLAGRARHTVARLSRSPITNLHLLNERCEPGPIRERAGEEVWATAMAECERAAACFPGSLHAGVDLLIGTGFRRHAVLEVNAFGDLLPGTLWAGRGTYEAEIMEMG